MHAHRSKRDLASASPESISYSSPSDSTAHRFQHGHQHDRLHGPYRGRGLNNSDHAVLRNGATSPMASGPFAASGINAAATGDGQPTATVTEMSGATRLSENLVEQTAEAETNASPLADGQDLPHQSGMEKLTVPQSLLEDQSAVSESISAYSGTSATSNGAAYTESRSILQQEFSRAGRVSLVGEMASILRMTVAVLWVFFFATMYR